MAENEANAPNAPPKKFAPIGPGNHERAWNDPPMFATEFNVTGKTPANKLNKRVAYPISASGPSINSAPLGMGPPGPGGPPIQSQPQQLPGLTSSFQQQQNPPGTLPIGGYNILNGNGNSTPAPPLVFQTGEQSLVGSVPPLGSVYGPSSAQSHPAYPFSG